jgi:hypothetical protein
MLRPYNTTSTLTFLRRGVAPLYPANILGAASTIYHGRVAASCSVAVESHFAFPGPAILCREYADHTLPGQPNLMQHFVDQHPVLYGLLLVGVMLPLISFVGSWWSGWAQLARAFPARQRFQGTLRRFQSADMRLGFGYSSVINAGVNSEGLYLATWRFFPMFHSPLFIPWAEIYTRNRKTFWNGIALELGTNLGIRITLYGKIRDDIRESPAFGRAPL